MYFLIFGILQKAKTFLFLTIVWTSVGYAGNITYKIDADGLIAHQIKGEVTDVLSYFEGEFGKELTRKISIIVSDDPVYISVQKGKLYNDRGLLEPYIDAQKVQCARRNVIAAGAGPRSITMCLKYDGKTPHDWLDANSLRLRNVVFHELFHIFQHQISGFPLSIRSNKDSLHQIGPTWMLEGSAYLFANRYIGRVKHDDDPILRSGYLLKDTLKGSLPISEMETFEHIPPRQAYLVGAFAVDLLTQKSGEQAIIHFYENVESMSWKKAFLETFGLPVEEFYQKVDAMRKNQLVDFWWK